MSEGASLSLPQCVLLDQKSQSRENRQDRKPGPENGPAEGSHKGNASTGARLGGNTNTSTAQARKGPPRPRPRHNTDSTTHTPRHRERQPGTRRENLKRKTIRGKSLAVVARGVVLPRSVADRHGLPDTVRHTLAPAIGGTL